MFLVLAPSVMHLYSFKFIFMDSSCEMGGKSGYTSWHTALHVCMRILLGLQSPITSQIQFGNEDVVTPAMQCWTICDSPYNKGTCCTNGLVKNNIHHVEVFFCLLIDRIKNHKSVQLTNWGWRWVWVGMYIKALTKWLPVCKSYFTAVIVPHHTSMKYV